MDIPFAQVTLIGGLVLVGAVMLGFISPHGKKPKPWKKGDSNTFCQYEEGIHYVCDADAERPVKVAEEGVASLEPTTLIATFKKAVENQSDRIALRVERNGEWKSWTWREYYDETIRAAKAFMAVGVEAFGSVNIIGFNSPEWFMGNMGAIAAGAKAAGIYTTNSPEACKYITEHSRSSVVIAENVLQLNKYLEIRDELPLLKAIVLYADAVPENANKPGSAAVYTWAEFLELGNEISDSDVNERIDAQRPGHCCTLIYTSGTTGLPKAVMISHDNITWTTQALLTALPASFGFVEEHIVSYLPLSHIAAQILDMHAPIALTAYCGGFGTVHFARPDALRGTLGLTLKECRPTVFFGVPRVWEKIHEKMKAVGKTTKGLKKKLVMTAKTYGAQQSANEQMGGDGSSTWRFRLFKKLIFDKVRTQLGLDRCSLCFTGAAPIGRDTLDFFGSLYLPVMELFGMSECTGPQTVSLDSTYLTGACGPSLPGCELKIEHKSGRDEANEGEICFRGRHIMMGYLDNEEKTKETIDSEGWLHSGDVGSLDEFGLLHVTGRIKELIITAGGENIAPVPIENFIKANLPGVSNVVLIGDRQKFLVCLITLQTQQDPETGLVTEQLINESAAVSSASRTISDARNDPIWTEYVNKAIKNYNSNQTSSNAQKIQKFTIVPEFSVESGALTSTLKIKRPVVVKMHNAEIESMYC